MPFAAINEALDAKLVTWLTANPTVPCFWPNQGPDPSNPPSVRHLRVSRIPAPSQRLTTGTAGQDSHKGIYQVAIFERAGAGTMDVATLADSLRVAFAPGTVLTGGVRITRFSVGPTLSADAAWYAVPLSISYELMA